MNTITIQYPDSTPLPFIVAALMPFGAQVIEGAASIPPRVSSVPKRPRAPRQPVEYRELVYTRPDGKGGRETAEMDGVEVAQRIRRLMAECAARWRHDGRHKSQFPTFRPDVDEPASYIKSVCTGWNHKPWGYVMGGETIKA